MHSGQTIFSQLMEFISTYEFNQCVKRYNGNYKIYSSRPANLGEVHRAIIKECHEYYLDGPNGFDWIFRNDIIQLSYNVPAI
jgi:hypothetical protein